MQDAANRHPINVHKYMLESILKVQLDSKVALRERQVTPRDVSKKRSDLEQQVPQGPSRLVLRHIRGRFWLMGRHDSRTQG